MTPDNRLPNRGPRRASDEDMLNRIGLLEERVSHLEATAQNMSDSLVRLEADIRQIVELWQQLSSTVKALEVFRRIAWWGVRWLALPILLIYQGLHVAVFGRPSPSAEAVVRWVLFHE